MNSLGKCLEFYEGRLLKRYKRFLADVELNDGSIVTAHCPNSGAMLGLVSPGTPVWVSQAQDPRRKCAYTWEMAFVEETYVGVNTHLPNGLVAEAIKGNQLHALEGYASLHREVPYDTGTRCDMMLQGTHRPRCIVEVKNAHLKRGTGAFFPDSVTARGAKHMRALQKQVEQGNRAVVIYVIQRADVAFFSIASDLDPTYAAAAVAAHKAGVEAYAYTCQVHPNASKKVMIHHQVPVK